MNTNFFNQIAQLNIEGNLQINIQKTAEHTQIVSVLLQNENCGDTAKNNIPPLILKGTADDLDNGFFENISQPLEQTSALMLNMEAYLKAQELAKKQSAMEKEKAEKEKKQTDAKEKKYQQAMSKTDKLEAEGDYRKAWTAVPEVNDFPHHEEEIRKRKKELSAQFAPDLFK
ncbi:PRTRC system protein E [Aquimarina longa]|uniref:PRTRC system protein E n=1 Tax=Aquimarina longa TaxID=1080221 RepID=UPI0007822816|nr:PRTRC system protein E [Aquimarina longa]